MLTPVALPPGLFRLRNNANGYRIHGNCKHNRDCLCCGRCRQDPVCTSGGDNYLNMTLNKVCDQLRKPIIFSLGKAVLDCDVLVFHETQGAETFAEGDEQFRAFLG